MAERKKPVLPRAARVSYSIETEFKQTIHPKGSTVTAGSPAPSSRLKVLRSARPHGVLTDKDPRVSEDQRRSSQKTAGQKSAGVTQPLRRSVARLPACSVTWKPT